MKVAIAGYGVEGEVNYRYYRSLGYDVTIIDQQQTPARPIPAGAKTVLGPGSLDQLMDYDMVIRTASMNPSDIKTSGQVWSATNEFFDKCPAKIIGVTGTKGKGTTCSLITSILQEAGVVVHLVGNIGMPALEVLPQIKPDDIVIFELSSFQLWDLKKSPSIAVVLMIEPDHLDVHDDFHEYIDAKSNIIRYQKPGDKAYYYPYSKYSVRIAETAMREHQAAGETVTEYKAQTLPYIDAKLVHFDTDNFYMGEHTICSVNSLRLPGKHNIENACAAISVALNFEKVDDDVIRAGMEKFDGLPHRLKFVREVKGVKYYDDSIATTPGSSSAALSSFSQPKVVILGGSEKGSDYRGLVELCRDSDTEIIAIGHTGENIHKLAQEVGAKSHRVTGLMPEAVSLASDIASEGSIVMLSPASASFDQYASYSDRGDKFILAVESL